LLLDLVEQVEVNNIAVHMVYYCLLADINDLLVYQWVIARSQTEQTKTPIAKSSLRYIPDAVV